MDPIFWLGLSILLVAISIAAVLIMMVPALKELGRAAQGAEKLFETLNRELPPTLESIRLTSLELTQLTDDVNDGVQSVGQVVQQIDSSMTTAKVQAQQVTVTTKSLAAGFKAAWRTLTSEDNVGPQTVVDQIDQTIDQTLVSPADDPAMGATTDSISETLQTTPPTPAMPESTTPSPEKIQ